MKQAGGRNRRQQLEQLLPSAAKAQLDIDPVKLWGLKAIKDISFVRDQRIDNKVY